MMSPGTWYITGMYVWYTYSSTGHLLISNSTTRTAVERNMNAGSGCISYLKTRAFCTSFSVNGYRFSYFTVVNLSLPFFLQQ